MNRLLIALVVWTTATVSLWAQSPIKLTPYLPATGKAHTAVIVCPGGSYCWLDHQAEGKKVGEWLRDAGIAAFVLKYRTAGVGAFVTHYRAIFGGNRHPDMIQDLQKAIRLVRENADRYLVNPERIGVMGFSAGGHLAMSSALFFDTDFTAQRDAPSGVSLRPDFVALMYPVVTLADKRYVHRRSRRGLLGEWRKGSRRMQDSLSLERQIRPDCPPVFLANCVDDPVVNYYNSVLLDSALTAHRIPHTYIQYRTGGHGFGADSNKGTAESAAWKKAFFNWLDTLF